MRDREQIRKPEPAAAEAHKGGQLGRALSSGSSGSGSSPDGPRLSSSSAPGTPMPSTPARDFERRSYQPNAHHCSPQHGHSQPHQTADAHPAPPSLLRDHQERKQPHGPAQGQGSRQMHGAGMQPYQEPWAQGGMRPQPPQQLSVHLPPAPPSDMPPAFHCTLCGISTASAKNYWAHVQGRAHARRAVKAGEQLPPSYSPMISVHVAPPLPAMPTLTPVHSHGPHPPPHPAPHPAMFRHMGFMPGMQGGSGAPMQAAAGPTLNGPGPMHPLHPQPLWPGGPPPPPQLPVHHPAATRPPSFHPAPHPPAAPAAVPEEGGRAMHRRFRCDTCDIYTTSAELLESHLAGRKHLRRLVSLAEQRGETLAPSLLQAARCKEPNETPFFCTVCRVYATSKDQLLMHMEGKKHQRHVENQAAPRAHSLPSRHSAAQPPPSVFLQEPDSPGPSDSPPAASPSAMPSARNDSSSAPQEVPNHGSPTRPQGEKFVSLSRSSSGPSPARPPVHPTTSLRTSWRTGSSDIRTPGASPAPTVPAAGSAGHAKQAEHQQHSRHLDEERGSGSSQGDAARGHTLDDAQPEILDDQASLSSVGTEPLEEGLSQDAANIRKDLSRSLSSLPPLIGSGGSLSLASPYYCPVCGVIATSEANLAEHQAGRRHAKRIAYLSSEKSARSPAHSHLGEGVPGLIRRQSSGNIYEGFPCVRVGEYNLPSSMDLRQFLDEVQHEKDALASSSGSGNMEALMDSMLPETPSESNFRLLSPQLRGRTRGFSGPAPFGTSKGTKRSMETGSSRSSSPGGQSQRTSFDGGDQPSVYGGEPLAPIAELPPVPSSHGLEDAKWPRPVRHRRSVSAPVSASLDLTALDKWAATALAIAEGQTGEADDEYEDSICEHSSDGAALPSRPALGLRSSLTLPGPLLNAAEIEESSTEQAAASSQTEPGSPAAAHCSICDVHTTSVASLEAHLASQRHRQRLARTITQSSPTGMVKAMQPLQQLQPQWPTPPAAAPSLHPTPMASHPRPMLTPRRSAPHAGHAACQSFDANPYHSPRPQARVRAPYSPGWDRGSMPPGSPGMPMQAVPMAFYPPNMQMQPPMYGGAPAMMAPAPYLMPGGMPWHIPTPFPPEVLQHAGLRHPRHPPHPLAAPYLSMHPPQGRLPGHMPAIAMMPPYEYLAMQPIHPGHLHL